MDVAVNHVLDKVGGDTARVQQGGAFCRGTVAGHRPAVPGQFPQERKQLRLQFTHVSTEAGIALEGVQAGRALPVEALADLRHVTIGRGPPHPPAQRAAVELGKLRHPDNTETVPTHEGLHRDGGKIAEMFMVNRVELGVCQ